MRTWRLGTRHPLPAPGGFSLIETLIGAALLLLVVIGILPLFTRAMMDNSAGADYTKVTNFSRSEEEDFAQVPITQTNFALTVGQTTNLIEEYLDPTTSKWLPWPPPGTVQPLWHRMSTVRNYNLPLTFNPAQPTDLGAPVTGGQPFDIEELEVKVNNLSQANALGARRQTVIRLLKTF